MRNIRFLQRLKEWFRSNNTKVWILILGLWLTTFLLVIYTHKDNFSFVTSFLIGGVLASFVPTQYPRIKKKLFLWLFPLALVSAALGSIYFIWEVPQRQVKDITDVKDRITIQNAIRTTFVQIVGGSILFVTAYVSWQNLVATQEKQVTDRFAKGIEQLGSENIHVRIGAIYALERIAKDSDRDYWQVMEVLTAYVRERSPYPPREQTDKADNIPLWASVLSLHQKNNRPTTDNSQNLPSITTDIQAVLTVISRRTKSLRQGKENRLDFNRTNLQQADLEGANLQEAQLWEANLQRVFLYEANLQEAQLWKAKLQEAILIRADLSGAKLQEADLSRAYLSVAKLQEADLSRAYLLGAYLLGADLSRANLLGAYLSRANLLGAYLSGAKLQEADLLGADLSGADLSRANLQRANLQRANLSRANLSRADLSGAKNLTPEQVVEAINYTEAIYTEEFRNQLDNFLIGQ